MRVVVVGAGIVGAAAGYELSRRGAQVLVADRGDAGQATAAGAGIVAPWLAGKQDPDWYGIASTAAGHYPRLLESLAADGEVDLGHAVVGGLLVHRDPRRLDGAAALLVARQSAAPELVGELRRLDPAQARALFPPLDPALHALHVAGVSRVDGRLLRDALLRAAGRYGATRRTAAVRLRPAGPPGAGRLAVLLDGVPEPADAVVVAAGAWSAELCTSVGVRLPVLPQRGQVVHMRLSGSDTAGWPVVQPPDRRYLLSFPGSRVVAGATQESGSGFDHRVTVAGQVEVLNHALTVAPGLAAATLLETRVGFRPVTPDGLPLLGTVSNMDGTVDGLVVATGMGPSGLAIGPYAGLLAARLAVGEDPGIDLGRYRPDRAGPAGSPSR